jgi:hypothetical protein
VCVLPRRGDDTHETDEESLEEDSRTTKQARSKVESSEQEMSRYQDPVEVQMGRSSVRSPTTLWKKIVRTFRRYLGLLLLTQTETSAVNDVTAAQTRRRLVMGLPR